MTTVDVVLTSTDNPRVMLGSFRRPALGLLLTATTASATVLPPSHIHLAADDHDDHHHAAAVEHSHWAAHGHSTAQLDDDDGRVLFVERPAISSSTSDGIDRPATALVALPPVAPPLTFTRQAHRSSGNAPRDGPPRGSLRLRAPPAFPA